MTWNAHAHINARMNTVYHIRKNVLGVSQAELAEIARTTQASVSRWERGELSPDLEQLLAIRSEVQRRKLKWNDAWFFDAPKVAAE